MSVLEYYGRIDGRGQVIRFRVREQGDQLVVLSLDHAVRQQRRVGEPLDECAGHGVAGQHVGHTCWVGHMAGKHSLGEGNHWRWDRVDHRQTERVGQVRNEVEPKRLD